MNYFTVSESIFRTIFSHAMSSLVYNKNIFFEALPQPQSTGSHPQPIFNISSSWMRGFGLCLVITGQLKNPHLQHCNCIAVYNECTWTKTRKNNAFSIYLLKVNNRNIRTRCKICSKLTMKTIEQCHWRAIVNFEHISLLNIVFVLLTLNR